MIRLKELLLFERRSLAAALRPHPLSLRLLAPSLSKALALAKLFLAREKKVFTLWSRLAGTMLCSHWLKPTLATSWFANFPILQDIKKKGTQER